MADNINIREEIGKLVRIQEFDAEAFDLGSEKETFPGRIKEMDDLLEKEKTALLSAEEGLKKLQVEKDGKEGELASCEEKIKKHDGELMQIKTNKEYKAMLEQIESVKADVSLLEEGIIGLLDEIESGRALCEKEKKIFEEEKKKSDKEKEEIRQEEKKIDARLSELKAKKDAVIAEGIDENILKRYERVLGKRGKYAVAKVDGECCGGCSMALRPQIINEVKLLKDVVFCENCARILYAEE